MNAVDIGGLPTSSLTRTLQVSRFSPTTCMTDLMTHAWSGFMIDYRGGVTVGHDSNQIKKLFLKFAYD